MRISVVRAFLIFLSSFLKAPPRTRLKTEKVSGNIVLSVITSLDEQLIFRSPCNTHREKYPIARNTTASFRSRAPHGRRREINFHPRSFRNKKPVSSFVNCVLRQSCTTEVYSYCTPRAFSFSFVTQVFRIGFVRYRKNTLTRRARSPRRRCILPRCRVSGIHRTTTPWRSSAQPDDRTLALQSAKLQTLSYLKANRASGQRYFADKNIEQQTRNRPLCS